MYGYEIFHPETAGALLRSVREGTAGHAYIFNGESGLGRHETARLLAAAFACRNQKNAPCGQCPSCVQTKAQTNPDVITVQATTKKSIGTDEIRDLNNDVYIKPFAAARKIYIIEADQLTEAAQNAFLKTLEEPPEYAVFILISENADRLLQTIRSRCTIIPFPGIRPAALREYLRGSVPDDRLELLIHLSAGNPGRAKAISEDDSYEPLRQEALLQLERLFSRSTADIYPIAAFFDEHKDELGRVLDLWHGMIRDLAVIKEGNPDRLIHLDMKKKLSEIAAPLSAKSILLASKQLSRAWEMNARYVNTKALCENLCLNVKRSLQY